MSADFINELKLLLSEQPSGYASAGFSQSTPFNYFILPEYGLLLHLVDYSTLSQSQLPPLFFQQLSLAAQREGLQLLHVWEDQWLGKHVPVKGRILNYMQRSLRVSARQCAVQKIDKPAADAFFDTHHLQGSTSYYYKLGLYKNGLLLAAIAFSKARIMTDAVVPYRSYELVRFAVHTGYSVVGALGKLLKHFTSLHHVVHLMSYIDLDWGSGKAFLKLGFSQTAYTAPQKFVIDLGSNRRSYYKEGEPAPQYDHMLHGFNAGSAKLILDLRTF